ncbi:DUF2835 domain-containing protein [Reinekea blandensis]|uniref:Topoisomerase II n=1 Tax=Reinekea blandensis MED297 TaxID=314283 RepID=A4BHI2_9GAMM|nr:DUF2835 domain-containing protein [Reinekea blandensis]EAR08380.1 hypothetical protein MED297_16609 [Reinekea blandensis MED297]
MSNQTLIVDLQISADDYLLHYQGHVKQVSCVSRDGRRVQFPTKILQPFVTRSGIHGVFAIEFDRENRFVSIKRLA